MSPTIAVVGSADPTRTYDPPLRNADLAAKAAEELGSELAAQGCSIVVYSSDDSFIEHTVVRGYIASRRAQPQSIQVRGPYEGENGQFTEAASHRELFDVRPTPTTDWEVGFYRSLLGADGILLLGGGRSTFITGLIALSLRIPLASVAAFGGAAEKAWHYLCREPNMATEEEVATLARTWDARAPELIVSTLIDQHNRRTLEKERIQRMEHKVDRHMTLSFIAAITTLLLTLTTIPVSYLWHPGTPGIMAVLVAAPLFAATCGAIIRSAFDKAGNLLTTTALGAAAGTIAFLLFVAAQLTTSPDILGGDGVRRLLFFVIPVAFTGGLTFDAVYSKLRSRDVVNAATLNSDQDV